MTDDDEMIGQLLSRREAVAIVAAGTGLLGAGVLHAAGDAGRIRIPACVVRPAQTEGPYFIDGMLQRTDIRTEPSDGKVMPGRHLALELQVSRLAPGGCTPIPGAIVDIWQCDAAGVYSGVRDNAGLFDTRGKQFLRGLQRTDKDGTARFVTIYPGWYPGRAVHIHFKVRTAPDAQRGHEFTSQVYFDETMTDTVHATAPYNAHAGTRTRNTSDSIYRSGGSQLMLTVQGGRDENLRATFDIGLQI